MAEDALIKDLSAQSREALQRFFIWAKKSRSMLVKDIEGELAEYRSASLLDESYNKADVSDILNGFLAILKVTIEKEHKDTSGAFADMLRQLLISADQSGANLTVDTTLLDRPDAGNKSENVERLLLSKPAGLLAPPAKPKAGSLGGTLAPLGSGAPTGPTARELELEEENRRMVEKMAKLQQTFNAMMQEKSKITAEFQQLRDKSSASATSSASSMADFEAKISELKSQLATKDSQIESGQKELAGKLNESQQFKQLKKMLTQKNQQVKELRQRLTKYEPEAADAGAGSKGDVQDDSSSEDD